MPELAPVGAGTAVAAKAEDSRMQVSTLPAQAAAGENERPDAYVQAPQGLFPSPVQQSELAGVRAGALELPWKLRDMRALLHAACAPCDVRSFACMTH
jgi:hypothetical protein